MKEGETAMQVLVEMLYWNLHFLSFELCVYVFHTARPRLRLKWYWKVKLENWVGYVSLLRSFHKPKQELETVAAQDSGPPGCTASRVGWQPLWKRAGGSKGSLADLAVQWHAVFTQQLELGGFRSMAGSDQQLRPAGLHVVRLCGHWLFIHINDVLKRRHSAQRWGGPQSGVDGRARSAGSPFQHPGMGNGLEFSFASWSVQQASATAGDSPPDLSTSPLTWPSSFFSALAFCKWTAASSHISQNRKRWMLSPARPLTKTVKASLILQTLPPVGLGTLVCESWPNYGWTKLQLAKPRGRQSESTKVRNKPHIIWYTQCLTQGSKD